MIESTTFHLVLYFTDLSKRTMNNTVNLSTVPAEYHKFADIFSKTKAKTLASYYPYNLQIKLENREKLSGRTICLSTTTKQEVLKKFISENLNTRSIYPTFFFYRASVLFVKKKDSSLYIYVDFQELNYIM